MLDEKKLKEAESRVKQYIRDGLITTKGKKEFVKFFLTNAKDSMDVARALYALSTDKNKQNIIGLTQFNGLLWVVNASYYSIFYMTRALLENEGVKLKADLSIHTITFDALVYYFYLTGKLQKRLVEYFAESQEEASELLGRQKASELIEQYFFEKRKRATFTYEMGAVVIQAKAKTSLKRAKKFNQEIKKIIEI